MAMKNMKMLMIVYNHSLDDEMIELLKKNEVGGYTKIEHATGEGGSEPHLGTNVWPATNSVIYCAIPAARLSQIKKDGKELAAEFVGEGLRLFVWDLAEMQ
jgi:hypothetical protein